MEILDLQNRGRELLIVISNDSGDTNIADWTSSMGN